MIPFVAFAALLTLAAAAAIAYGLLRAPRGKRASAEEINAAVYRDQLAELDLALAEGTLSAAHHAQAREAIRHRLAEDLATGAVRSPRVATASTKWMAAMIVVVLPLAGALLYALLGTPAALDPAARRTTPASDESAHGLQSQQIATMVERLAARLRENPDDLNGWVMLARSYSAMGRFDESSRAYAEAAKLAPKDATLLADYADVLVMAQGRRFDGEPDRLVARALAADPKHGKSLALAGTSAFNRRDYATAVRHWSTLRAQLDPGSEMASSVDASIAQARQLAGGAVEAPAAAPAKGFVSGTVKIAPALEARVAPGDTLFIFARAPQGSRMPVAVVKRPVGAWPVTFRLDDATSMPGGTRLSSLKQVVLEARISKGGAANAAPGDLRGTVGPLDVGREGVAIEIASVVE